MSTETKVVLTTLEVLKLRKAGWDAGWQEAEVWQEQHIDSDSPARMPDYTRGEMSVGNFVDDIKVDDDDEFAVELRQAYLDAVESILDDAAGDAWNEFRDQHCDEDNYLIRDDE